MANIIQSFIILSIQLKKIICKESKYSDVEILGKNFSYHNRKIINTSFKNVYFFIYHITILIKIYQQ